MHTLIPTKYAYTYPLINDSAASLPYVLAQYPPNLHPTVNSSSLHTDVHRIPSKQNSPSVGSIELLPHSTLFSQLSKSNLLNDFLNT